MWEIDLYDWSSFEAYSDPGRVPELLHAVAYSQDEREWSEALASVESCSSDLGVPSSMTPAVVSCLVSAVVRVSGSKRSAILSSLEELTCGRGAEQYSEDQQRWLTEAVYELVLGLKLWVEIMENGSIADAEQCVDILAYCAEHVPGLRSRVAQYLASCGVRFPQLRDEIRAVSEYFEQPSG